MKDCNGCKYADWKKTVKGRLHPSGDGMCKYNYKVPELPQSMYWIFSGPPSPAGGYINRKNVFDNHCVYYQREEVQ